MSSGSPGSAVGAGADTSLWPLTPAYNETEHGVYLQHLREALDPKRGGLIHNIALTGGYGVGKSSILQELSKEFRDTAVTLSLPTLGETVAPADGPAGENPVAASVTNRIQKEIVKQLLYREQPERVPSSRYRRRTAFNWRRGAGISSLAAAALMVVLYLAHAADRLADLMGHGLLARGSAYVILLLLSLVIFTELQRAFHDQARIQQFVAGPASVTLAETSDSYFDEWLDEIVYFFEATKVDILIFEDIDRFDDPHIFETLRELNTILNNSKQLHGRSVRFIYAIKDSIFEQLGHTAAASLTGEVDAAEAEVWRANRTKFFDLVIPVVPFITHRSARDLMSRQLEESQLSVSRDLVHLAARHVADMRLITNIHNEFIVFREKLLSDTGMPGLGEDQLFAMMLYKNVHLSDFELIRTGRSQLDALYRDSRHLVNENMRALNSRAHQLRQKIADPDPLPARSHWLGERLEVYIKRHIRHWHAQAALFNMEMSGQPVSREYLRDAAFWRSFLQPGADLLVRAGFQHQSWNFNFRAADIGDGLGEDLAPEGWKAHDVTAAERELARIEEDRALLVRADMQDLFDRPDLTVGPEGYRRSFAEIAKQALGSQLAFDLVANGYINRNFTLYVSQYHGVHVSSQAMNFILHNVQPNVMDPYFRLDSPGDVEAVLHECGLSMLTDRSSYNITILDHLVEHRSQDADTVIRQLVAWGPDEQEFIQAYVAGSGHAAEVIRRLSRVSPQTLPLVVRELDVDEQQRAGLADAALQGADPANLLVPDEAVKAYIERNYWQLAALTDEGETTSAERIVGVLDELGVMLPAIQPLSDAIREGVIEHRLYLLSRDNLVEATGGGKTDLALDHLKAASGHVYDYVLDNLRDYVAIVTEETDAPRTIEAPEQFADALEDVAEHDPPVLQVIIEHASPECRISDLAHISEVTWPALAHNQRFPVTFANISAYAATFGIDENLAVVLLADPKIAEGSAESGAESQNLAIKILAAGDHLPDPDIRVQIVQSLRLDGMIEANRIHWERGKLAGLLVEAGIVDDTEAVYEAIADTDWATKEFLISKSTNFAQYVTPQQLPAEDLRQLLASKLIVDAVKRSLLARIKSFASTTDPRTLQTAADYAFRMRVTLDADTLVLFARAKITATTIIPLLQGVLPDVPPDTLTTMLEAMGEQYARLAAPGLRPAKLPNDPAHEALAAHLQAVGNVSSFAPSRDRKTIKVNMKHQ